MRKLVLLGTLLALAACKPSGSKRLEGHWKGIRAEGVDPSAQANATAFALSTEIIAQGNQIAVQTQAGRSGPATYVVDKEEGATLVIHTDQAATETFTFTEKADQMTWHVDQTQTIVFRRVP
ncbi:MAG: hypothetical protein KIT84_08730 [Labilithrix sp.]|nr:hypothetical protein [Labilithrix sp.]MCW5811083.1 hypothetical protein [Labilithrix sp.]